MSYGIDPFDSPKYKLERAGAHASEFEATLTTFVAQNPIEIFDMVDPSSGDVLRKVRLTKNVPRSLHGLAGEAFEALRGALDQVGSATVRYQGRRPKKAYFPFADTETEARSANSRKRSKDLPDEIFDLMLSFVPFKDGDAELWALNKARNIGVHDMVEPVVFVVGGVDIFFERTIGNVRIAVPQWDRSKNEMLIQRMTPGTLVSSQSLRFGIDMHLGDFDVIGGEPFHSIYGSLSSKVEKIVLAVEDLCRRMGPPA